MSRELPARSTRGFKPTKSTQEQIKDNQFYESVFGLDLDGDSDEDEQERLKLQRELRRRQMVSKNLRKYSYSRGYTYSFDLDQFPRVEGQPSYAVDQNNVFGATYLQQNKLYKQSKLNQIINRSYFGLPYTEFEIHSNKADNNTKNACHQYLFDNQDKKFHIDRQLYSYKMLNKHFQKLKNNQKITNFRILKRQIPPDFILFSSLSDEEQNKYIRDKLQEYVSIKQGKKELWQAIDQKYFHNSLKQRLFDSISQLKKQTKIDSIFKLLFLNQYEIKDLLQSQDFDFMQYLDLALTSYRDQITQETLKILNQRYRNPEGIITENQQNNKQQQHVQQQFLDEMKEIQQLQAVQNIDFMNMRMIESKRSQQPQNLQDRHCMLESNYEELFELGNMRYASTISNKLFAEEKEEDVPKDIQNQQEKNLIVNDNEDDILDVLTKKIKSDY